MNNLDIATELRDYAYRGSVKLGGKTAYTDAESIAITHHAVLTGAAITIKAMPEDVDVKPILELLVTNYELAADAQEMPPLAQFVASEIAIHLSDILEELGEEAK